LRASRRTLVTTNYVIAESHGLIARRCGRRAALAFLHGFSDAAAAQRLVWVDETLATSAAANWLEPYEDRTYSLTDAVSFEVMTREGIRDAFAFDLDFERAGFRLLREGR
jgi:predicted nucleic acid-binding protein